MIVGVGNVYSNIIFQLTNLTHLFLPLHLLSSSGFISATFFNVSLARGLSVVFITKT